MDSVGPESTRVFLRCQPGRGEVEMVIDFGDDFRESTKCWFYTLWSS